MYPNRFSLSHSVALAVATLIAAAASHAAETTLPKIAVEAEENGSNYVEKRGRVGTKTDAPVIEVPQAISTVSRAQLTEWNVQRERDAVRYMPGVYAEPYGAETRYDNFFIRGFDQFTGQYRDGLRELRGLWSRFNTDPYGLESITVLRGPSSVLYGQNNPGGVVEKTTKKPVEGGVRELELQAGTFDRVQGNADFGGNLGDSLLYRLTGMVRESDTQFEYNKDESVPDDREYFAPALTWKISDATKLTVLGDYLHTQTASSFTLTPTTLQATGFMAGEPGFNNYEHHQRTIGYRLEHAFGNALTFVQNARYGTLDFTYGNVNTATKPAAVQLPANNVYRAATLIDEELDALNVDNQLQLRLTGGRLEQTWLAGVDYQDSDYVSYQRSGAAPPLNILNPVYGSPVAPPTTLTGDRTQDSYQWGAYLQNQIRFDNKWIATLGVRQDWAKTELDVRHANPRTHTEMDDEELTARVGLTRLFENGLAPYVSYSQSFLPISGATDEGQPFKPTTGDQYEVGVKFEPHDFNGFMAVSVFELTQQNVVTPEPLTGRQSTQTGEIRSRGVELEAVASLATGLNLVGAYTYLDLEVTRTGRANELGKSPVLIPETMASLWLRYTLPPGFLPGLGVGTGVRYTGPTFFNSINTLENGSNTVVDASLSYEMSHWRFAVNANNVLDKEYDTCWNTSTCTLGLERTVIGSVKFNW